MSEAKRLEPYARFAAKALATPERLKELEEFLKPLLRDPSAPDTASAQENGG